MPTPQSDRHPPLPAEASDTTRRSNASVQADVNESSFFLNIPNLFSGALAHASHARSRSVDDSGGMSTPFGSGRRKPSDFVTTGLIGHSQANLMTLPSGPSIQAQNTATSSLQRGGKQKGHNVDVFYFGDAGKNTPEPVFSFGSFHNYTPLPSPRASPAAEGNDASWRDCTSSHGSSPQATTSMSGGHLSPPHFSLNLSSSESTSNITDRVRSLSLGTARTDYLALSTSSQNPPDGATNSRSQKSGSESYPEPYDPREEPGPEHEYFTSSFQQKLQDGASIAKDIVAAIEKLGANMQLDGKLAQLLKESKKMTSMNCETTRKIAILGDSGEGEIKSFSHFRWTSGVPRLTDL